jgi:hypothetical protein
MRMDPQRAFRRGLNRGGTGCRVLVSTIGSGSREHLGYDAAVYRRHYSDVEVAVLGSANELCAAIASGYDIIHLVSHLAPGGWITDTTSDRLRGTDLVAKCCERDVKLLWIAGENSADDYIEGFKIAGKPINVVMTISRNGEEFARFLERLLTRTSSGDMLPQAWAALAPQAEGPWQRQLPSCIFFAGRPQARLQR